MLGKTNSILGSDSLAAVLIKGNIAMCLAWNHDYDKAIVLQKEIIEKLPNMLSPTHEYTLSSVKNLANSYMENESYDEAIPVLKQLLDIQTSELGSTDRDTLLTKRKLKILINIAELK